jgi:hypothetical protein
MPSPFTSGSYEDAYYNSLDESGKNQLNYASSRYGAYGRTGVVAGLANNPNYVAFINANKPSLDYSLAQQGKLSWADFYRDNPSYAPKPDPLTQAMSADVHKVEGATAGLLGIVTLALMVPGVSSEIGSGILAQAGITGASPAVNAAVGSAAINTATTLAQGGNFEQVLQSAASGAAASGINVQMGGGVTGAVVGSAAGTAIAGGDANQVVMNALAAGVGAGVQGATGSAALGSLARSTVITGEVSGENLFNAAIAGIKAGDSIEKTEQKIEDFLTRTSSSLSSAVGDPFKYGNITYQEMSDGSAQATDENGKVKIIGADYFKELKEDYRLDTTTGTVPTGAVTLEQQQIIGGPATDQVVSDTVTTVPTANTDSQVLNLIANAQPTANLETVVITEPAANVTANVSEVVTGVSNVANTDAQILNLISGNQPTANLDSVIVTGTGLNTADQGLANVFSTVTDANLTSSVVDTTGNVASNVLDQVVVFGNLTAGNNISDVVTDTGNVTGNVTVYGGGLVNNKLQDVIVTGNLISNNVSQTVTDVDFDTDLGNVIVTGNGTGNVTVFDTGNVTSNVTGNVTANVTGNVTVDSNVTSNNVTYPTVTGVPPKRRTREPIITGATTPRLLADALAAYRPSGAIEGKGTGDERQDVWNEKSLRLRDALGL